MGRPVARRIAVILAAGKGTRMRTAQAKVLHPFLGRPLVSYPIAAAEQAGAGRIVLVTGYQADEVQRVAVKGAAQPQLLSFAHQAQQLGTGHAVRCALQELPDDENAWVWILNGDTPRVRPQTLTRLLNVAQGTSSGMAMTTVRPVDCEGYGRLIRGPAGNPAYVREQRDCAPHELAIRECNAGMYGVRASILHRELVRFDANNAQQEIYLTDLVAACARTGVVGAVELGPEEAAGINTVEQLRALEQATKTPPTS